MYREDQWKFGGQLAQHGDEPREDGGVVNVGWPMESHQPVGTCIDAQLPQHRSAPRPTEVGHQGVDHDVADEVDLIFAISLGPQVVHRIWRRRKEVVADPVGDHPIYLFGHRPVAAAQPGFDVGDVRPGLGCNKRTRDSRIDVADDDDEVRTNALEQRLESGHHPRGLDGVSAGADLEAVVGWPDTELLEEDLAHAGVVVLPGVYQNCLHGPPFERIKDRLDFDEVGPRPGHTDYSSHAGSILKPFVDGGRAAPESGGDVFTASLLAFSVTLVLGPVVIRRLTGRGILDVPGDRSNHTVPTPRGGGIAVMAGVLVGVLVAQSVLAVALLMGILIAAGVGALEDLRGVPIVPRLLLTSFAALALLAALAFAGLPAGLSGILILLVAVPWTLAVINAVNFMDGIDGISAATAIVVGSAYALLGRVADSDPLTVLGLVTAAAAAGFAPYNVPRALVFLGDVGSYGLGATFAAMSLLAVAEGLPLEAAIAPLALYLADTGMTIVRRVHAGEPWHLPHRRHVYQRLVALGFPHVGVSATIGALTAVCAGLGAVSVVGSTSARVVAGAGLLVVLATYLALPRLLAPSESARQ